MSLSRRAAFRVLLAVANAVDWASEKLYRVNYHLDTALDCLEGR